MNVTGDGEQQSEALPGTAQLPLSAPVTAGLLPPMLNLHQREPGDEVIPSSLPARQPQAGPPVAAPPVAALPVAGPPAAPPAVQAPTIPAKGADRSAGPPDDPQRAPLREQLDAMRIRAAQASSWLETSVHYARLVNRDGVVPVTGKFTRDDIEFLGLAREEVLGFAELGLRLLELHAPLDAGGISTDPSSPILRCRSCMWRWPCPTFRMLTDALSHLPHPGLPPAR